MAAVLAASALVLTACNGGGNPPGGDPSASGSVSASASATPSPTPTASAAYKPADAKGKAENVPVPVLPEAAKAETKEGLEAFAKYWYEALSYAYETGDTTTWSAMTSTNCAFCTRIRQGLESAYAKGRWVAGGKMSTPSVAGIFKPETPSQQVKIQSIQDQIDYYDADGSVGQPPTPSSNTASVMIAVFESGSWKVSDLGLIR
ncbi:DUF6318 family protein [Arthrobacter oryzae]|uniref:DUF6318 family protein n=1 Tax=Arthrobacter oryzae TaxID=409290 RepID=UPI0028576BB1|nr:DUF6318 family protein [Arthrobacter oryzae]MDR6507149.1 hypothetical protein [Arthrobacter oryzae]